MFSDDGRQRSRTVTRLDTDEVPGQRPRTTSGTPRVGLNHLPSGRFAANAAWLVLNVMAHNLGRWVGRIGLGPDAQAMTTKTLRTRLLDLPGRMTTSGGKRTLHLPEGWPWEEHFTMIVTNLRAIGRPMVRLRS